MSYSGILTTMSEENLLFGTLVIPKALFERSNPMVLPRTVVLQFYSTLVSILLNKEEKSRTYDYSENHISEFKLKIS